MTAPDNVPPRIRAELMKLMATFVDSELAGSAGFADAINLAPGIKERIAASRIVLEKADHAERVLALMGEFGTDTARYQSRHDWAARLPRDADIGPTRSGPDRRLSVFHYPLAGWTDAVAMNALMGLATVVQLGEFSRVSYAPLAETLRAILPRERRHAELGLEGLRKIVAGQRAEAQAAVAYWTPRVADTFGARGSENFERLVRAGLRHRRNEELLAEWGREVDARLAPLGLTRPGGS
jgi:ring-1,2-phenylacetyl-CoA epoxidase subunit PaaA